MFCRHCNSLMKHLYRFENGKAYRLYRCPTCYIETKPRPFYFSSNNKLVKRHNKQTNKQGVLNDNQ